MKLSYATQQAILMSLIPIAERSEEFGRALLEHGWTSWLPRSMLEQSFSQSNAEISEWRIVVNETIKVRICCPNIRYGIYGPPYVSSILESLRKNRDGALGHPYSSKTDPIWTKELDPCRRRMGKYRIEMPEEFAARLTSVELEQDECRKREVNRYGEVARYSLEKPADIFECYREIMNQQVRLIGFEFDNDRSVGRAVYSRQLVGNWRLCLSPEPLAWHVGINKGDVVPLLSLQNGVLKGYLQAQPADSFLLIEYDNMVEHFQLAYKAFASAAELNVILKARIFLLGNILSQLERSLVEELRKYA